MAIGKTTHIDASVSDSAIDGLGGGLLAGLAMGSFLVLISWPTGIEPAQLLNYFDVQATPSPFVGGLIHLAVSGVYGIAYGLLFWLLLRHVLAGKSTWAGILAGIVYGLLLWLAADLVLLPATNPLRVLPGWGFAAAHVLYGAILGGWVLRNAIHRQADQSQ